MNDEQINAAIAEACGWIYCDGWNHPDGRSSLPDYVYDLNAMHEAEKSLNSDDIFQAYYLALYETTQSTRWPVCATARQRAEAFLKTLGKWEEVQG